MSECQSRVISAIDQLCQDLKQAKSSPECDKQLIQIVNQIEAEVLNARIRLSRQKNRAAQPDKLAPH